MSKRLVSLGSQQAWFSPFVDVAVNGMMAMFVFLIVYIAAVPPRHDTPRLRILTTNLPAAVWYNGYQTAISASGGAGSYHFTIDQVDYLNRLGLLFDPTNGMLFGTPRSINSKERQSSSTRKLHVVVEDESQQRAEAYLELRIFPVAIPFDPERQPLRLAPVEERLQDAWIGRCYTNSLPVLGGIEDYEFRCNPSNLPAGLTFSNHTIVGIPSTSSVSLQNRFQDYLIAVEIRDQQTAYLPFEANREPRLQAQFRLRVWRPVPITLKGVLPMGRAGQNYTGAIVAWGGSGRLRWSISDQSSVALILNQENGLVSGEIPRQTTPEGRPVDLTFCVHVEDLDYLAADTNQVVAIRVLPPMQFLTPK